MNKRYSRALDLPRLVEHRSLFLFGPRQTGKSTLIRQQFPDAVVFDLLEADTFRELSARPETMRQSLRPSDRIVVIDEVQKLPALLDEVHLMIERDKERRFILTGSSARKLKRGNVNLLAGRAWTCNLHPLVASEIADDDRLVDRLNRGSLPAVLDSAYPAEDLRAYVGTYLQEEIRAEGLSRSIAAFSRFLEVAGQTNGEQVNFSQVGSDCGVPARTVREYYQVLQDTLVGHLLPSYLRTIRRKPVATPRFYFFDIGVANTLMKRSRIRAGPIEFGRALEHLIFLEVRAYLDYHRIDLPLTYWRTQTQLEVDFVIGDHVAIEVKGKSQVARRDYKGLLALAEEVPTVRLLVVSLESRRRLSDDGVEVIPVVEFLHDLWAGQIISANSADFAGSARTSEVTLPH